MVAALRMCASAQTQNTCVGSVLQVQRRCVYRVVRGNKFSPAPIIFCAPYCKIAGVNHIMKATPIYRLPRPMPRASVLLRLLNALEVPTHGCT